MEPIPATDLFLPTWGESHTDTKQSEKLCPWPRPFGWVVLDSETDRPAVCKNKQTNGCGLPFQNFKATDLKIMQDLEGLRCKNTELLFPIMGLGAF